MAADGNSSGKNLPQNNVEWSTDPTILKMQKFAHGYGPDEVPAQVDRKFIRFPWFRETKSSIDRSIQMARGARKENCVRGEGPSRSGKTSVSRALLREHLPWRDKGGLHMPWAYMRVHSVPSVATVGEEILRSLGDSSWKQRRRPIERLSRIGEVAEMIGLEAIIVDDLHHLVDTRGARVQHAVADLFIDIGNETDVPFIFLGLERMGAIFDVNEQIRGRTGSPIEYLRLDWRNKKHKELFSEALNMIINELRSAIQVDETIDDPTLLFRMYCSSGGLFGYLVLILRVAEDECRNRKVALSFAVLRKAVGVVVGKAEKWPGRMDPFHPDFVAEPTDQTLMTAQTVGKESGPGIRSGRK